MPRSGASALSEPVVHILLSLADGPLHGYGIILRVEEWTDGRLVLKTGTLYTALRRLSERGLIETADVDDPEDERRIHYRLTPEGRAVLRKEAARVQALAELTVRVVG
jgi:DNA-binding PadR family transcriptional regulator